MTGTRIHNIWRGIKVRCYNPNSKSYSHYGGRGIKMSSEWYKSFLSFNEWSMKNGYDDLLTIDRIDVDGDYCASNCRWVDMKSQQNNRSNNRLITFNGITCTEAEWAEKIGVSKRALNARLVRYKWSIERALTQPQRKKVGGHYV